MPIITKFKSKLSVKAALLLCALVFAGCGWLAPDAPPPYHPVDEQAKAVQALLPVFLLAEHKYYEQRSRFSPSCAQLQSYDREFATKFTEPSAMRRLCELRLSEDGQKLRVRIVLAKFNDYIPQVFALVLTPEGVTQRRCQAQVQLGCVHGTWQHLEPHSGL